MASLKLAAFVRQPGVLSPYRVLAVPKHNFATEEPRSEIKPLKKTSLSSLKKGRGGRSSFSGVVATVFGSSGFLGRYVVNKLGKQGSQVIVPYRCDHYDVMRLKLCGDLGQILFLPIDLRDEETIRAAMKYSNVVINLIGRDYETRNFSFDDVHVTGARTIARLARECGVEKLIHVSSLNIAERPSPGVILPLGSRFLQSKCKGEKAVHEEFPDAVIFRTSEIYGSEDRFLRYYIHGWRRQGTYVPLWNKGNDIIKQPVFVQDVAKGIVNAIYEKDSNGKTYQAVGPSRYELGELVDWFYRVMRRGEDWGYKRTSMNHDVLFWLKVKLTYKFSPMSPLLNWDKIEREHTTDVVHPELPTLEDLGVVLTHMENQVPWELRPYKAFSYYEEELREFEKPTPPPVVNTF